MERKLVIVWILMFMIIYKVNAEGGKGTSEREIFFILFIIMFGLSTHVAAFFRCVSILQGIKRPNAFSYIVFLMSFILGTIVLGSQISEDTFSNITLFIGVLPMIFSGIGLIASIIKK